MAEHLEATVNDLLGYDEVDDNQILECYPASKMYRNKIEFSHCFADRFHRYLDRRGMTIEDVAKLSGVTVTTIKKWVGARPVLPATYKFLQLCEALECTPSELLGY